MTDCTKIINDISRNWKLTNAQYANDGPDYSEYEGDETLDDEMANRDPRMYQIIDSKYRPNTVAAL